MKIGDIVQMKGGGPFMCVTHVEPAYDIAPNQRVGEISHCSWFVMGQYQNARLPVDALVYYAHFENDGRIEFNIDAFKNQHESLRKFAEQASALVDGPRSPFQA